MLFSRKIRLFFEKNPCTAYCLKWLCEIRSRKLHKQKIIRKCSFFYPNRVSPLPDYKYHYPRVLIGQGETNEHNYNLLINRNNIISMYLIAIGLKQYTTKTSRPITMAVIQVSVSKGSSGVKRQKCKQLCHMILISRI